MKKYWESFISLFYPKLCFHCSQPLTSQEEILCLHCFLKLPKTNYHLDSKNPLLEKLNILTKLKLTEAFALLKYNQKGISQELIHALKYNGQKHLGISLGKWIAGTVIQSHKVEYDALLPVPLYAGKKRSRGYNQAEILALGINEVLNVKIENNLIERTKGTISQAKKGRIKRWTDGEGLYKINKVKKMAGKNILIVDDVITTGSTVIEISKLLLENGVSNVSVACIATGK